MTGTTAGITGKIMKYELHDVTRSRWLFAYTGFFLLATDALLRFSDGGAKALLSLMNVVLIIIPLVTVVFATMYLYNAREFTELLLAQPVSRRQLFGGLYLGLTLPLAGAFALGVGLPFAWHGMGDAAELATLVALIATGVALTAVFSALAYLIATRTDDKVKGLGIALGAWLAASVLYDGLVLFLALRFADYPVERPLLGMMLANPVDLARIVLLLQFDVSALMGYTGAVFKGFFGSSLGITIAATTLLLWIAAPVYGGLRAFERKDF